MYNADCRPLLPFVDLSIFRSNNVETSQVASVLNIVFTGAIYSGQADSVRRLVHVLDQEPQFNASQPLNMHLTLYTMMSEEALSRMGMLGNNVSSGRVTNESIPDVLSKANIAFVPIYFEPAMRHFAETSFPTKIAEYVASGVPILAHVPPYSTVARYCREHGCGLVVDEPNEESLRDALILLRTDATLRTNLSMRALEAARRKHDAARIAPAFLQQLISTGT
jgi:glycosyltransferase involved in cell wall biosynthesis